MELLGKGVFFLFSSTFSCLAAIGACFTPAFEYEAYPLAVYMTSKVKSPSADFKNLADVLHSSCRGLKRAIFFGCYCACLTIPNSNFASESPATASQAFDLQKLGFPLVEVNRQALAPWRWISPVNPLWRATWLLLLCVSRCFSHSCWWMFRFFYESEKNLWVHRWYSFIFLYLVSWKDKCASWRDTLPGSLFQTLRIQTPQVCH